MRRVMLPGLLLVLLLPAGAQAASTTGQLRAGAGRADITPPQTGYYLGGWTRADRTAQGQSTRLFASALVLQRGTTKVALVSAELFAIPAGLQEDVARAVADLGYDKTTVLLAASHTHSGPGGFSNNPTFNTAAPSPATATDPISFEQFIDPKPADPQLYTFLVKQIAAAIRRADGDRALAEAGWGHTDLFGVTQNRSIEAYLRNLGIVVPTGQGSASMDPKGVDDTVDGNVEVLRVDKLVKHGSKTRHVPIGAYSNFADHGTIVHSETQAYSGDHHATAWRVFVDKVRKSAHVARLQTIVNVYPNGAEGDMTAGIVNVGPAAAVRVGSLEADAMFAAWQQAGSHLSRTPEIGVRWTRTCFCGRMTATGPVDTKGKEGEPFLTGSEEGRGPLYDITHVSLEGSVSPLDDPVQGDKVVAPIGDPGPAVPVSVMRIGDGVLAALPGEPTKEVGVHVRAAVLDAMKGSGVTHVIISGLAGDYIQYITTPAEYGAQSYEGGSTLFGKNEATFLQERLAELAGDLAAGTPAPEPYALDPSYGVKPNGPAYGAGAESGTITTQPASTVARLGTISLAWTGGPDGHDRPVDKAFVSAQRIVGKRWRTVDSDLGLAMLWRVDGGGHYTLDWQPPTTVPAGTYRFRVTASRYALISTTFTVTTAAARQAPDIAGTDGSGLVPRGVAVPLAGGV